MSLFSLLFKRQFQEQDYSRELQLIESGHRTDIDQLLYKTTTGKPDYLPITYSKFEELRKPAGNTESLIIHQRHSKAAFDLLIISIPWSEEKIPFYPLLFLRRKKKDCRVNAAL